MSSEENPFEPPETMTNLDPRCDAYRGDDRSIRCVLPYHLAGPHSDGTGQKRIWLEPRSGRRLEAFILGARGRDPRP